MKRFPVRALLFILASSVFAVGPQTVGSSHAESGYDYKDITVAVLIRPAEEGRLWLNANYSHALLFSEKDRLVNLVQTAAKKIDIATSNKTSISYLQEVGGFYTENGALVTVAFDTDGYGSSYAVVRVMGDGNNDILLFNKKDTGDFIGVLGSVVDDYQRQVALFK
jgi:hypothetical protein